MPATRFQADSLAPESKAITPLSAQGPAKAVTKVDTMEKELISPDSGLHRVTHCIKWGNLHRKKGLFGPKIDQETFLKETPEEKAREGGDFSGEREKLNHSIKPQAF